ncbi:9915_t:CDS:10 [Paraglomus occultum]|uniref:DNA mismatch repair protein PMS1 n=1 Tax=Paraglomus occultum TaxID=144539 RepID=A0A9N8WNZ1_9GLOM|nr:9915_t:CDS:10 [Paraglomus occultum]
MTTIKAIDKSSVHRICSGQVIVDLSTTIKELVENSLDAQATSIAEVRLKNHGLELIEVIDNGIGIPEQNYEFLALKHHTSKLSCFEDLTVIESFGFRGEALSSLSALSKLTVITSTEEQAPSGRKLEYDANGRLAKTIPTARERGTTVSVQRLFESLPVRQKEFKRNVKREFAKALTLLQAYGIISEGVKITCTNQTGRSERTTILATSGNKSIRENFVNIFGAKQLPQVMAIDFQLNIESERSMMVDATESDDNSRIETVIQVVGYISKPIHGCGRNTTDRQYYYINGRPCTLPKAFFNEVYKTYNSNQLPFVIADVRLDKSRYDVNVSPDKRTIYIHDEKKVVDAMKNQLIQVFEPFRSTFSVNSNSSLVFDSENSKCQNRQPYEDTVGSLANKSVDRQLSRLPKDDAEVDSTTSGISEIDPKEKNQVTQVVSSKIASTEKLRSACITETPKICLQVNQTASDNEYSLKRQRINVDIASDDIVKRNSNSRPVLNPALETISIEYEPNEPANRTELSVQFDINKLKNRKKNKKATLIRKLPDKTHLVDAGLDAESNAIAERELNRVISKEDFIRMKVVGQFNLGFIIVKLDSVSGGDLFIVDQHASDEKYNFETLQRQTRLHSQQLISPMQLQFTAAEELVAIENIDVLKANGFELQVDDKAPPTRRLKLVAQPISKNTVFGTKDLEELIFLLAERPGEMVHCSQVRNMFASRACRKSVMIGDPLNKRQMKQIVNNMGTISQPWNCPHGRPTMRHLFDLSQTWDIKNHKRRLDKGSLVNSLLNS